MASSPLPKLEGRITAVFIRQPKPNDTAQTPEGCASTQGCDRPVFTRQRVPASQAVEVGPNGLAGNVAANNSGRWVHVRGFIPEEGYDRAVLIQTSSHMEAIRGAGLTLREPLSEQFTAGCFGENLFVDGADFHAGKVCVGDEFSCWRDGVVQALRIQVASPRLPCGNIDIKNGNTATLQGVRSYCAQSGNAGFFLRVLSPGDLKEGDTLRLASRSQPKWDCARVSKLMYSHPTTIMHYLARQLKACKDRCTPCVRREEWMGTEEELRELAAMPELANVEWKENLALMLGLPGIGRYRPLKQGASGKNLVVIAAALAVVVGLLLSMRKR